MQNLKKSIVMVLILIITISTLVSCSGKEEQKVDTPVTKEEKGTTNTKKEEKPKELVEISVMLFDRSNIPDGEGTIDDNRWTQWLNEKMNAKGIKVNFQPLPRSEEGTKIPVLMASGTASDVMMTYNSALVEKYYRDGGTYELSKYIDEHGSNLKKYLGEEVLNAGKLEDGSQFAIPARRATRASHNFFIRKDWLDELNMQIPTTVDELYEVLKAFKEKDPGGVGKENVIPYWGEGYQIQLAFLKETEEKQYYINSGADTLADEGMKEFYRFKNKLYNDGLMDPEYFTEQNFGQREREAFVRGVLGCWESNVNANVDSLRGQLLQNLKKNEPDAEFISILPPKNIHDGQVYTDIYAPTGGFNFIPKTAEHPEAVVQYLDFLAEEGGFTVFHGFEGEHFEYQDGIPVVIDSEHNAQTKDWIRHDLFLVGNQGYYETEEDFAKATAKELPDYENYVLNNYENAVAGTTLSGHIYKSETQVEQRGNIKKVDDDYTVKLVTCNPAEFDEVWDEYISELLRFGADKILEERAAYFNK